MDTQWELVDVTIYVFEFFGIIITKHLGLPHNLSFFPISSLQLSSQSHPL